jgi:hypothetical protein
MAQFRSLPRDEALLDPFRTPEELEDEMGYDVESLLKWMADVAAARNCDSRARTVNLKFTKGTLDMWQERVSNALTRGLT